MLVREETNVRRMPLNTAATGGMTKTEKSAKVPAKFKRILVPLDFSPAAMGALDRAMAIAGRAGGSLLVLHVMDPMYASGTLHPMTIIALKDEKRQEIKRRLAGLAERTDFPGLIHVRVVEGSPDTAITEVAARSGCDLIVMGTRGRTGLNRLFHGSVAERVVRHSDSPVLVVPDPLKLKARE